MTKEVMVTISGLHLADGDQDEVELVHVGEYYERNGTHYVLFEELLDGISEPVKNRIKMKDGYMEVQKKGPVMSTMAFEEGKSMSSTYSVPYGSFLVTVNTTGVQLNVTDAALNATASYELIANGEHCADCDICVKVEPRENFHFCQE